MNIHEKLSSIQKEFKANKSRFNSFGKYNFRSAEDILEALKPFNEKYKVYFTVSEEYVDTFVLNEAKTVPIIKSTAKISDGETSIEANAIVGIDLNQKGMQVPQQFGSASSYAKKYSLGNLLLIDDTQDSDASNTHGKKDKPKLRKGSEEWAKALQYLSSGGSTANITAKYNVSVQDQSELKSYESKNNQQT